MERTDQRIHMEYIHLLTTLNNSYDYANIFIDTIILRREALLWPQQYADVIQPDFL